MILTPQPVPHDNVYVCVFLCMYTYISNAHRCALKHSHEFLRTSIHAWLSCLIMVQLYVYTALCVYVYACIFLYTHIHTHNHTLYKQARTNIPWCLFVITRSIKDGTRSSDCHCQRNGSGLIVSTIFGTSLLLENGWNVFKVFCKWQ